MKCKRYLEYHVRWQVSALVMMPVMYSIDYVELPLWSNLMITQFIGAIIFWKIDKWLFEHKIEDEEEST